MKNYIAGLVLALCFWNVPRVLAQEITLTPKIGPFSTLKVSSGVQVFLTQLDSESLRIEAKGFDRDDIVAEVKDGELRLSVRLQGWLGNNKANRNKNRYVKAYLTARQLTDITVSAGAQLTGESTFKAEKIGLHAKSGADLTMALNATDVDLSAGAGASATVTGTSETITASASAGATVDADELIAATCQAEATSGATVRVYAEKELFLKASTGGSVSHKGPGRIVSRKTSLGGSAN